MSEANQLQRENERLFDLVRHQRVELHQLDLITDDEYAKLCEAGSTGARKGSRQRLESYDDIRRRLGQAEAALRDEKCESCGGTGWLKLDPPDEPMCQQCKGTGRARYKKHITLGTATAPTLAQAQ